MNPEPVTALTRVGDAPTPDAFARLWSAYPLKVGKGAALKAFVKLRASEGQLEAILAAVAEQQQSDQWQREGGRYIPHLATWLNQGRWEDEVTAPVGAGLSDTARHNLAAVTEMERILRDREAGGHREH